MPVSVPSLMQPPRNTSPWTAVGGWHVALNQYGVDPCPLLFEADNNANLKYLSQPTPGPGQNPNVSAAYDAWVKVANNGVDYVALILCNQQNLDPASATGRGYLLFYSPAGPYVRLFRNDGGGAAVLLGGAAISPDALLHHIRWTREVSGANRFHRVYYDDMVTPLIGPVNDATYTNFSWWGFYTLSSPRVVVGGEMCQS